MLGAQIGDAQRMFERGAGRDDLLENPPQMVSAERPRVVRDHPFEHLALAHRLINRRAVAVLEMADLPARAARAD